MRTETLKEKVAGRERAIAEASKSLIEAMDALGVHTVTLTLNGKMASLSLDATPKEKPE